jgi:hypothetical protein
MRIAARLIIEQLVNRRRPPRRRRFRHDDAAAAVVDRFLRPAVRRHQRGQAARLRFHHDLPERVRCETEDEQSHDA